MSSDAFGSEDPVGDVMRGLIPALDPPLDVIDTRASTLRRTFRLRMAGLTGALVIGTVATAGALTGGTSKSAVEVENRDGRHSKIVVTPTTQGRNTHPDTNTTVPTSVTSTPGVAPVPTTNSTPGGSTPSSPGAPAIGPVPTTARTSPPTVDTVPGSVPTTATTVPAPTSPPIGPNHTRMTVILDDTGLHAPSTFKANYGSAHAVEILFLDRRSNSQVGLDYLKTDTGILVRSWITGQPISAWALTPGTLQLGVLDYRCLCAIPGVTATITIVT